MQVRILLFSILLLGAATGRADENFGRFFTTPAQRQYMDQLRQRQNEQQTNVKLPETRPEANREMPLPAMPVDKVQLKGLVYRKDGKSTAWISGGNSYEGSLGSQYTNIDRIGPGKVTFDITGSGKKIKLRVGQSYLPDSNKILDVISKQNAGE